MSLSVHQIQFAYNNVLSFMSEKTILSSIMSPFFKYKYSYDVQGINRSMLSSKPTV